MHEPKRAQPANEPEFTEWQIFRISRAIADYRVANTRNGEAMPWADILAEITASDANQGRFDDDDEHFKPESLRRFAERYSDPKPDKIDAVCRFLLHEGFLESEDLVEDNADLRDLLAVHAALAREDAAAKKYLKKIEPRYTATASELHVRSDFALSLRIDPGGTFFRAEEEHVRDISDDELAAQDYVKDNYELDRVIRKGYGFASTALNLLCVFLIGPDRKSAISYIQVNKAMDDDNTKDVYWVRSGDPTFVVSEAGPFDEPIGITNVYKFASASRVKERRASYKLRR